MLCAIEHTIALEQANKSKQPARVMMTPNTSSRHDAGHDICEAAREL